QAAADVLDELTAGDEAAVVRFADTVQQVVELTSDLAAVRAMINQTDEAGYQAARFYPALRLANDMLTTARHERRRIVMISSFPASGVTDADAGWMLAPGVGFAAVQVGDRESRNLTLSDVR